MTEPAPADIAILSVTHRDGTTRSIAYRHTPGAPGRHGPTIVFLPGYMSDMAGSKASNGRGHKGTAACASIIRAVAAAKAALPKARCRAGATRCWR